VAAGAAGAACMGTPCDGDWNIRVNSPAAAAGAGSGFAAGFAEL